MDPRTPRAGLEIRGEQQLQLLPRMLQSIEVLQLAAQDLESWLREAANRNEALEVLEPSELPPPVRGPRGSRELTEAHDELLRNQPARPRGMPELVEEQLCALDVDPELLDWVRMLVSCIDDSGFLSASDEELLRLARERGLPGGVARLGQAIAALQGLEPRGVGARDVVEALLLQLDANDPDYAVLCRLIEECLEDLARNRLPRVAKTLGLSMVELQRLLGVLRGLDPRPLRELDEAAAPPIEPELLVEWTGEGHEIQLLRSRLPSVRLDDAIVRSAADSGLPAETRRYLRRRIDDARWIVLAVEQRHATLLRVAGAVFARQSEFLARGPGHLRPLRMAEVAAALGVHPSTVSRAVAGKHVQTPWGIQPLRSFFQASAGGDHEEGGGMARDDLRDRVRAVFAAEDRTNPLSDDEVASALAGEGLPIARRTVAKYRRELGIPSSYRRRSYEGS